MVGEVVDRGGFPLGEADSVVRSIVYMPKFPVVNNIGVGWIGFGRSSVLPEITEDEWEHLVSSN